MDGFLYIATGEHYIRESILSARSLRTQMPDANIALAADMSPSEADVFDRIIRIKNPEYSFRDQIRYMERSPYERTIVIDTDIYFDGAVHEVFDLLDRFDIAVAHNQNPGSYDVPGVPDAFPEYNSGVIGYRTESISEFLSAWDEYYQYIIDDDRPRNQPSFRKALYESDLRLATLPREYNAMVRIPGHAASDIKVFHGRLLDTDMAGAGHLHDIPEAATRLNAKSGHRVWLPVGGLRIYTNRDKPLSYFWMGVKRYGIRGAISRTLSKIFS